MYTVTKEGEENHTKAQALWRMIGINITPIAPHEARAMNIKREIAKINRLKGRMKLIAEKALFNNMSIKDIKKLIDNDAQKLIKLTDKIKGKLSKPLPEKFKRSKEQRLKAVEKFLKARKKTDQ